MQDPCHFSAKSVKQAFSSYIDQVTVCTEYSQMRQCFCPAPPPNHSVVRATWLDGKGTWTSITIPRQRMNYSTGDTLSLLCKLNYALHGIINIWKENTSKKYHFVVWCPKYSYAQHQIISKECAIQNIQVCWSFWESFSAVSYGVVLSPQPMCYCIQSGNLLIWGIVSMFLFVQSILLQYSAILDI